MAKVSIYNPAHPNHPDHDKWLQIEENRRKEVARIRAERLELRREQRKAFRELQKKQVDKKPTKVKSKKSVSVKSRARKPVLPPGYTLKKGVAYLKKGRGPISAPIFEEWEVERHGKTTGTPIYKYGYKEKGGVARPAYVSISFGPRKTSNLVKAPEKVAEQVRIRYENGIRMAIDGFIFAYRESIKLRKGENESAYYSMARETGELVDSSWHIIRTKEGWELINTCPHWKFIEYGWNLRGPSADIPYDRMVEWLENRGVMKKFERIAEQSAREDVLKRIGERARKRTYERGKPGAERAARKHRAIQNAIESRKWHIVDMIINATMDKINNELYPGRFYARMALDETLRSRAYMRKCLRKAYSQKVKLNEETPK